MSIDTRNWPPAAVCTYNWGPGTTLQKVVPLGALGWALLVGTAWVGGWLVVATLAISVALLRSLRRRPKPSALSS